MSSDATMLPRQVFIAEFFDLDPVEKFRFMQQNVNDETVQAIHNHFLKVAIRARNLEIAQRFRQAGGTWRQVNDYFGLSDNIGRSIRNGEASDPIMTYLLNEAGEEPEKWLLTPREHHKTLAMRDTVVAYRQLSLQSPDPIVRPPRPDSLRPSGDAHRIGTDELSLPHAALMRAICQEEDVLYEWIQQVYPVTDNFEQLPATTGLKRFLRQSHEIAMTYLHPNDEQSRNALAAWSPDTAPPQVVLGRIAEVWNPFQVYWHFVQDSLTGIA